MWPYPKVIAHRGGGTLSPENTLAAMQCGLDYGFAAVEFDVMLSKDGIPVLMHDPNSDAPLRVPVVSLPVWRQNCKKWMLGVGFQKNSMVSLCRLTNKWYFFVVPTGFG